MHHEENTWQLRLFYQLSLVICRHATQTVKIEPWSLVAVCIYHLVILSIDLSKKFTLHVQMQGRIQDLIRGGPDRDRPKLLMVHSSVMRAKRALFSVGSGACLRAPEALGYFITKYAFSPFSGTFLYYF